MTPFPRVLAACMLGLVVLLSVPAIALDDSAYEDMSKELVEAFRTRDSARFEKLLPTYEEFLRWVTEEMDEDLQSDFTREWYDSNHLQMVELFTAGLDYTSDEHPCVDPALLTYAGHGIDEESDAGTYGDYGSQLFWIDFDATYPGTGALRFRTVFEVKVIGDRVVPLEFDPFLTERPSKALEQFTRKVARAFLDSDLILYGELQPTASDVEWYAENRLPQEDREEFWSGWSSGGSPLYIEPDVGTFYAYTASRQAYMPGEVASFEITEFMVDDEVYFGTNFLTHEVSANVSVTMKDGSAGTMETWLEIGQGDGRLTLVEFDLGFESSKPDDEEWVARVDEGQCWAARGKKALTRLALEKGDYDRAILLGSYLVLCSDENDPKETIENCFLMAVALAERNDDLGDLARGADYLEYARTIYEEGGVTDEYWDGLVDASYQTIATIATNTFLPLAYRGEKKPSDAVSQSLMQAVIRAGTLIKERNDAARNMVLITGGASINIFYDEEDFYFAFEIGKMALPMSAEVEAMDRSTLEEYLGIPPADIAAIYVYFVSAAINLIAPGFDDYLKYERMSDFMAESIRERAEPAARALRIAATADPDNPNVAQMQGTLKRVFDALEAEGK